MTQVISKLGDSTTVVGKYYTRYSAVRNGKRYETSHLFPGYAERPITATDVDNHYAAKGRRCPFNGDSDFRVIWLQQA